MNILAISVHPDDETLGCGGTLLRHVANRDRLHWLIVTKTYEPVWNEATIVRKAAEVEAVSQAYQMRTVHQLGLPTMRLDTLAHSELIDPMREILDKVKPQIVYLVHGGDVHTDHYAVFVALQSVLKAFYMRKWGIQRVLSYETLSSTEAAFQFPHRAFMPNVYGDITPYLERKIEIMSLYRTETQPNPYPRGDSAIRALARFRGASVGIEYAEAFMLLREVL